MWAESIYLIVGLVILIFGAELLIRGARNLAHAFGLSPLIVGLTVVAFGTSAPELFVSLIAAFHGTADVAVGNVIGSNLFNVLVIIGLTAFLSPVRIDRVVIVREMPIMLLSLSLFLLFSWNLYLSRLEGIVLAIGIFSYLGMNYYLVRRKRKQLKQEAGVAPQIESSAGELAKDVGLVILGLLGLVFGAEFIVDGATSIAKFFGVSDLIIAVTLVAAGTSLPELATTMVAAVKGESDLAVGNAIGSNIFNVFCVIGFTSIVTPLQVNPAALNFDMLYMFIACLLAWPLMYVGNRFGRLQGGIFLLAYFSYIFIIFYSMNGSA